MALVHNVAYRCEGPSVNEWTFLVDGSCCHRTDENLTHVVRKGEYSVNGAGTALTVFLTSATSHFENDDGTATEPRTRRCDEMVRVSIQSAATVEAEGDVFTITQPEQK